MDARHESTRSLVAGDSNVSYPGNATSALSSLTMSYTPLRGLGDLHCASSASYFRKLASLAGKQTINPLSRINRRLYTMLGAVYVEI